MPFFFLETARGSTQRYRLLNKGRSKIGPVWFLIGAYGDCAHLRVTGIIKKDDCLQKSL